MSEKKVFTWADLKKAVNEIPQEHLNKPVHVWGEDEGFRITGIDDLEEDYVQDGDDGCGPESEVRKTAILDEGDVFEDMHPIVFEKGTRILSSFTE